MRVHYAGPLLVVREGVQVRVRGGGACCYGRVPTGDRLTVGDEGVTCRSCLALMVEAVGHVWRGDGAVH